MESTRRCLTINYKELREKMVEKQLKRRGINNEKVLKAMSEVPRHIFVAEKYLDYAYEDSPLPIDAEQTISQPYIVARMIQDLQVEKGDKVLEIGTGSGYAAAVLSRICKRVYTIERQEVLAEQAISRYEELGYDNIEVRISDGTRGWKERAPFDRILVSAGAPVVPKKLTSQLNNGGIMIIPVGENKRLQKLFRIRKISETEIETEELEAVRFVPLIGEEGWDEEPLF
ncbi:MAG: protein-L-isoaspartate(D-aspartate) O-methyltransferase [Halanaerobiales bacterium]